MSDFMDYEYNKRTIGCKHCGTCFDFSLTPYKDAVRVVCNHCFCINSNEDIIRNDIHPWLDKKLADIATKLPSLVHTEPASFACGYNMGYKQALLDLDRELEEDKG